MSNSVGETRVELPLKYTRLRENDYNSDVEVEVHSDAVDEDPAAAASSTSAAPRHRKRNDEEVDLLTGTSRRTRRGGGRVQQAADWVKRVALWTREEQQNTSKKMVVASVVILLGAAVFLVVLLVIPVMNYHVPDIDAQDGVSGSEASSTGGNQRHRGEGSGNRKWMGSTGTAGSTGNVTDVDLESCRSRLNLLYGICPCLDDVRWPETAADSESDIRSCLRSCFAEETTTSISTSSTAISADREELADDVYSPYLLNDSNDGGKFGKDD